MNQMPEERGCDGVFFTRPTRGSESGSMWPIALGLPFLAGAWGTILLSTIDSLTVKQGCFRECLAGLAQSWKEEMLVKCLLTK